MEKIITLIHQKAPRSGKDTPAYFRRALATCEMALAVYFLLTGVLFSWANHRLDWMPLVMCAAMLGCRYSLGRINSRLSFYAFEAVIILWCGWHTFTVGWAYGAQHLLIPMLMLCFFNIYEPTWLKLFSFLMVVAYRMVLFAYSLDHQGTYEMTRTVIIIYQTMNTLTLFDTLAVCFIVFSSSIQETERQLLINNQELHKEAGTDPLTQLPNRRAMLDVIEEYHRTSPDEPFSIAIADIDFFKKVNDTYGHNCGDYTLKTLAELFMAKAEGKYQVCRWGGEEFCFFLPGMNLDQAGIVMNDLHFDVHKMPLTFGDIDFSITITIGVEEYDYQSGLEPILDRADRKLYIGKVGGRDQVVI